MPHDVLDMRRGLSAYLGPKGFVEIQVTFWHYGAASMQRSYIWVEIGNVG
jgi:hypothetical protein